MASDIFNWGSDEAYERLGTLAAGQRWHSFDVSAGDARRGEASKFVMAVWNYHFDPVTREQKDWAIKIDGEGVHWYPVRWPTDSAKQQNRKGLWNGIILAATQRIPMSAVLKDAKSRRCAEDFVFPVQQVGLATDAKGRTLWLRLGVTARGPGTTVDRIDRVPKFTSEWDLVEPAAHPGATPEAMESEARSEGWPEDSVRYGAIKARRGQADFRARLLTAYGRKCCISGCQVEALLEAAHIRPHAEEPNYDTRNGLLLRADLHTLYDLHLLGVDEFGRVHLSTVVADPYYRELVAENPQVTLPERDVDRPSEDDRRARMALFRRGFVSD